MRTDQPDLAIVESVIRGEAGAHDLFLEKTQRVVDACFANLAARSPWLRNDEADLKQRFQLMLLEGDYRVLRTFEGRAQLSTWIHVIALRFFRRQAGVIKSRPPNAEPIEVEDPAENAETRQLRRAEIARVREVLHTLEDSDRLLLQLLYEQELDATAAGKILGLTPSGVRMRKQRLLSKLVEKLKDLAP